MGVLQFFFGFSGRLSRLAFLFGSLILLAINMALTYFLLPLFDLTLDDYLHSDTAQIYLVDVLAGGLMLWPDMAVAYKRLHDLGYSGKAFGLLLVLTLCFFTAAGSGFFGLIPTDSLVFVVLLLIFIIILLVFLLMMLFKKGTVGENRYGPNPLDLNLTDIKTHKSQN